MKRIFFMMLSLLSISTIFSQIKEGTIVYEKKVNTHRNMTNEQMKAIMPEFRTSKHTLVFNEQISMYKVVPEENAPDPFAGSGGGMTFRSSQFGPKEGELYSDFSQEKSVTSTSLNEKDYLIIDTLKKEAWKLTGETKKILGYDCLKATRKTTITMPVRRMMVMGSGGTTKTDNNNESPKTKEIELVAWYTESIASPAGPDKYNQLPGVILQLDSDNGETVYTAVEVKTKVDEKQLKEPKKGKVVTTTEWTKIQKDAIDAMMQNMMNGGGIRIGQ